MNARLYFESPSLSVQHLPGGFWDMSAEPANAHKPRSRHLRFGAGEHSDHLTSVCGSIGPSWHQRSQFMTTERISKLNRSQRRRFTWMGHLGDAFYGTCTCSFYAIFLPAPQSISSPSLVPSGTHYFIQSCWYVCAFMSRRFFVTHQIFFREVKPTDVVIMKLSSIGWSRTDWITLFRLWPNRWFPGGGHLRGSAWNLIATVKILCSSVPLRHSFVPSVKMQVLKIFLWNDFINRCHCTCRW